MAEKKTNNRKRSGMKSLIGGTILTDERISKQFPFVVMLAMFGLALIMNRNWSEKTIRQIGEEQKELEALRAEHASISAKLMDESRPSEVAKRVEEAGIGLSESVRPPKKLIVETED
ncbi:FtsL-like putative cell division protein [Maribellus mangrovi]|uniref:FtsL-like putative cell division protein n=1 Tax=Maribellus mangrovi TaxID=3133146 RepID=UPI0030EF04E0